MNRTEVRITVLSSLKMVEYLARAIMRCRHSAYVHVVGVWPAVLIVILRTQADRNDDGP